MPTPPVRTIRVDADLWTEARAAAERRGTTRNAYLADKLRELVEADRTERAGADGLTAEGAP